MEITLDSYNKSYQGLEDTLYYKIFDRTTGIEAYVFSEYNCLFENEDNKIIGKCFYLHIPMEKNQYSELFKTKTLLGKDYYNLGYKKSGECFIVNSDTDIKEFIIQNHIILEKSVDNNIFAENYSCFDDGLVVGVSEPRKALIQCYLKNKKFQKVIDEIIDNFGVKIENLGLTGSLALGSQEAADYDIVFYGEIKELNRIKKRIDIYRAKYGNVEEYGLTWPCRYHDDNGNLICCFFVCSDNVYEPLKSAEIVSDEYRFDVIINDDSYSILKAPILKTNDKQVDSLIILNSAFKGIFQRGDNIQGKGKIIKYRVDGAIHYSILLLNPYEEIYDYNKFFNGDI